MPVCLLHAGQPKRASDMVESGEFVGEMLCDDIFVPLDMGELTT